MGDGHWIKDEEGFHHYTDEEYKRVKEAIDAEEFAQKVLTTGAIGALLVVGTIVAAIVGVGFLLFSIFDYVMQYLYKH